MIETTLFADFLLLWGSRFDPCTSMYEIPVSDSSDKPLQMFPMIVIVRAFYCAELTVSPMRMLYSNSTFYLIQK